MCTKQVSITMMAAIMSLLIQIKSIAQPNGVPIQVSSIEPYKLAVSFNKTTNLIFPYAIKSVDRGSSAILVQKAKAVENILQLKAAQQDFSPTNLSVVTGDGRFYSFVINYALEPAPMNMLLTKDTVSAFITDASINDAELQSTSDKVQHQPSFLHRRVNEQKMKLSLKGIYLSENAMWFKQQLKNRSLINYTPDFIQFFIRDRKRSKRTAVQENRLSPIYTQPSFTARGTEVVDFVYGFLPFTISKHQEVVIEITEQNGERTLMLPVNHNILLKARNFE